MAWLNQLGPALTGLFALCALVSAVDALFDRGSEGLRLVCGLSLGLYALKLVADILG